MSGISPEEMLRRKRESSRGAAAPTATAGDDEIDSPAAFLRARRAAPNPHQTDVSDASDMLRRRKEQAEAAARQDDELLDLDDDFDVEDSGDHQTTYNPVGGATVQPVDRGRAPVPSPTRLVNNPINPMGPTGGTTTGEVPKSSAGAKVVAGLLLVVVLVVVGFEATHPESLTAQEEALGIVEPPAPAQSSTDTEQSTVELTSPPPPPSSPAPPARPSAPPPPRTPSPSPSRTPSPSPATDLPPLYTASRDDVVIHMVVQAEEEVLVDGPVRAAFVAAFQADIASLVGIAATYVHVISITAADSSSGGRRRLAEIDVDVEFAISPPPGTAVAEFQAQISAADDYVVDCDGNYAYGSWINDGICDQGIAERSGAMINFDCAEHRYDGTDCDGVCSTGDVLDCNGSCVSETWIGDGFCDDPYDGKYLNCVELRFDGGDCVGNDDMQDCHGNVVPRSYQGDGTCDDGNANVFREHIAFLNCEAVGFDGNDCDGASSSPPQLPASCPSVGWSQVPYNWIDVQTQGTALALPVDSTEMVTLPFDFPFYDTTFSSAYVTADGYITFQSGQVRARNDHLPGAKVPNNLIAAYWDALEPTTPGAFDVWTYTPRDNSFFAVEWEEGLRESASSASNVVQFQAILYPTGGVVLQYLSIADNGAGATVGAENAGGTIGTEVSYNQDNVLSSAQAIALCADTMTGRTPPSTAPTPTPIGCESFTVEHGSLVGTIDHMGTMHLTCDAGYSRVGTAVRRCNMGSWDVAPAVCMPQFCPMLSVANGEVTGEMWYGGVGVTVSCTEPYVLLGDPQLNCLASGEWDASTPTCGAPPATCREGEIQDCTGRCADAAWLGDGFCDEDYEGFSLNCEALSFDNGDCADGAAAEFEVDCLGQRAPASWYGDGACDNGIYQHNGRWINFNCEEKQFDGGDCATFTLTHMECLGLVQDLDHCEALSVDEGYRCHTAECVQAIDALASGYTYCSDLLGLQQDILGEFQVVCGECSPMPVFEMCGLGGAFPTGGSECNTMLCAETMVPWYEQSFGTCQEDLLAISDATELQLLSNFYEMCRYYISSAAPAAAPSCPPVFLGEDIGFSDVMQYSDVDNDCHLSIAELAIVCETHYAECMSFLASSEDQPEPEPEPALCQDVYLGPDTGFVDIMEYSDEDGDCHISMAKLGEVCNANFAECMSFLNSMDAEQNDSSEPGSDAAMYSVVGWLLMTGPDDALNIGSNAEIEFVSLLRLDLAAALEVNEDYVSVLLIEPSQQEEESEGTRHLHVQFQLTAESQEAAQALFDTLVLQSVDEGSTLRHGVVSNSVNQMETSRDTLNRGICQPSFLGPDIGFANVLEWQNADNSCHVNMGVLASVCGAFLAECIAYVNNDANPPSAAPEMEPEVEFVTAEGDYIASTRVDARGTIDGYTTYRLIVSLGADAANVYSIFGLDGGTPISVPAAYQCASPFGTNLGGTNPAFWAVANNDALGYAEYDSWLTVGITEGDAGGALSSIGLDFDSWTESNGLVSNDGAVFWMTPTDGPTGEVVLGQITVPSGSSGTVTMGLQGRSTRGLGFDFQAESVQWSLEDSDSPPPAPPADACADVSCPQSSPCTVAGTCRDGICSAETNAPDNTPCDDNDGFTTEDVCFAGVCSGTEVSCRRPADVDDGYTIAAVVETNLEARTFDVSGLGCAPGYAGTATAQVCTTDGGYYSVVGCYQLQCSRPVSMAGYDFSRAEEILDGGQFDVRGVECATGYAGTARASVCTVANGPYTLDGCREITCTAPDPSSVEGLPYDFSNADVVLLGSSFRADGLSCNPGYMGTPVASICTADGEPYVVTGCFEMMCSRPSAGYLQFYDTSNMTEYLGAGQFRIDGLSCAPGFDGIPIAEPCTFDGWPYTLSGCYEIECLRPTDVTGYDISQIREEILAAPEFYVHSVFCAEGYTGEVEVIPCRTTDSEYTLSGCEEMTCRRPADTTGFDYTNAEESLSGASFQVTGLTCADGYSGEAVAQVCTANGGEYTLSGCSDTTCIRPTGLVGYNVDSIEETLTGGFSVTGVECAQGYAGTPQAAVCTESGGEYTLSGCSELTCTRPSSSLAYDFTNAVESLSGSRFAVEGVRCNEGYAGQPQASLCERRQVGSTLLPSPYVMSGCDEVTCISPPDLDDAYDTSVVVESSLRGTTFDVSGLGCAPGYAGTATAQVCTTDGGYYSVVGCYQLQCSRPVSMAGYDFSRAEEILDGGQFDVRGVECATGYAGTARASVCTVANGPYTLTGCIEEQVLQMECAEDEIRDCTGRCADAAWLGDGFCDEDYEGFSLNCEALSFDNGDCADGAAAEFEVDCLGQRAPASWYGDGACDNGIYQHNGRWINFNCMEASWDGGDCAALSLTHMDCLRLVQDLDHCEAVNDGDGYRCETSECVQAIQALGAGWDYCSDLLGLQTNVLADFELVCGECSPMPVFELCGLGVHFPDASSQCSSPHCADAMIPWYESKFTQCQSELTEMAEIAGLDVAATLTYTTSFHADCVVTQASNAPPPAPSCPPVFLGADIGWSDVMSYSDEDSDCVLSMAELATVCSNHFAECISFLESSEDAPAPEPEPEDYCAPVFLGPDIGYANIMAYNDADGSCTISMSELAATCADFFNECISFLNSAQGDSGTGAEGEQVFAIDGWLLMQGSAEILDLGGEAEVEFAALLRQDLSAALGTSADYIAVTNIYAADASEQGDVRSLHVSIELSAPGSIDAAQALFDALVLQQADETSALMSGVVSSTISQVEETRDVLSTRICEPVFLGPDIGYVNVKSWNEETGECETSMSDLAAACNAFFAECVAFLNSANEPLPEPEPEALMTCTEDEIRDCTGRCADAAWLGDGFCDEDYEGFSLNCEALSFDNGDCADGAAAEFEVDCLGQRAPASWYGDGACDNGIYQHNGRWINFNCMEASWDGGDCAALSLTHMDCLRLVQDLDHCEAVNDGDGYRCETSECVQAIQALGAGWDYCSDLLGLQTNVLADFELVCGECSPMPVFELCGLGVHFPDASSQCSSPHCADAMIPWYESKFTQCQSELTEMAEIAGLDVAATLTYTTSFHADCVVTQASNAPPPAPSCPPVFLGADIGWSDVMSYSDEDSDCVLSMAELATVCSNHFAECISFLESSEDAPAPEPEPEDYCAPVFLGPDIGYANIMAYNDADGSCTISMSELAATCADFFNECISFLNSAQGDSGTGAEGEQVFAIDGWLLMQGSAEILDLGGEAEVEFAALLRQDLSAALGTSADYIAVTNIYAADASEQGDVRSLHVSIELSAPGSIDAAQALFDALVLQQADETSALMSGVVSSTISQVEETRDVLSTRICEPVFLGPDIGYVNVKSWNEETGECETSMSDLAAACNAFFAECVAFLNSANEPLPEPEPEALMTCTEDEIRDCTGRCADAAWLGDGFCDEDYEGFSLNCEALSFDNGDCADGAAAEFEVDCLGQRAPASWYGDGACDNGIYQHNGRWINFNCMEASWDGGDCAALSLTHMDCLRLVQDLDHCEAVNDGDGYRCETSECVQAIQALGAGWDYCSDLLGLQTNVLADFELVCGECSPMPVFELCGLGVHFPDASSQCSSPHCADAMIPWYESKFTQCQSELTEMAEIAGLDVAATLTYTTSFHADCVVTQASNAPPPAPSCPPVFLGADIGWSDVMSYSDEDSDCVLSMAELATVCSNHFAECISFLESSEDAPAPEPEPEDYCAPVFLGPDIGYANIMAYNDADGSCTISMSELAATCADFFNECISFLNSAQGDSGTGAEGEQVFAIDGWLLMQGSAEILDLGGEAEVEFAALLRQDLSAALGTSADYIAVTNIYAADASEQGDVRSLHVSIELSAPGSIDAAQALFDALVLQQADETSALMSGVVSSTISQVEETRDVLSTRICEPVFLGPDIGYVNVKSWNEETGECETSMSDLAAACNAFFAECVAFLNSANEAADASYEHLTTSVITLSSSIDAQYATYQLVASLDASTASNMYTIFGTDVSPMSWPAAYQCATPFGANTGGTNEAFWGIANNAAIGFAEFDSWLSVGVTGGDTAGALSTIGLEFDLWDEQTPLVSHDGAVFWMAPDQAPGGEVIVGQITVAAGSSGTVAMGMQGKPPVDPATGAAVVGSDWTEENVEFTYGE